MTAVAMLPIQAVAPRSPSLNAGSASSARYSTPKLYCKPSTTMCAQKLAATTTHPHPASGGASNDVGSHANISNSLREPLSVTKGLQKRSFFFYDTIMLSSLATVSPAPCGDVKLGL